MLHIDKSYKDSYYTNSNNLYVKGENIIMKKRIGIFALFVCFLFLLIACQSDTDSNEMSDTLSSETEMNSEVTTEEESVLEEPEVPKFEEQVIYDADGLKVVVTDFYLHRNVYTTASGETERYREYPIIELEVTNNTSYGCEIGIDRLYVNEILCGEEYSGMADNKGVAETAGYFEMYPRVKIEVGETKTVYARIDKDEYYVENIENEMNVAVNFFISEKIDEIKTNKEHYTKNISFNSVYPTDSEGEIKFNTFNYDNIIFEDDEVILYFVSGEIYPPDEYHDKNYAKCVFLVESKIYEQPASDYNVREFAVYDDSYSLSGVYLVRDQIAINGWGEISDKTFSYTVVNEKNGKYTLSYGYADVLMDRDENGNLTYWDMSIGEECTVDIPESYFTYSEGE